MLRQVTPHAEEAVHELRGGVRWGNRGWETRNFNPWRKPPVRKETRNSRLKTLSPVSPNAPSAHPPRIGVPSVGQGTSHWKGGGPGTRPCSFWAGRLLSFGIMS